MRFRRSIPIEFALPVLVILLTGLVGAWAAPVPSLALKRFAILVCGALVFALIARLARSTPGFQEAVLLILLAGLVAALLSLVTTDWRSGDLAGSLPAISRLSSLFPQLYAPPGTGVPNPAPGANPRTVSGSMALFLPLAFSLALFAPGWKLRLLGVLSLPILLLPLLLSQSPQGLLAAAVGLALVMAFYCPRSLLPLGAAAAAAALVLALGWSQLPEPLAARLEWGMAARLSIWPAALLMLRDLPFTGAGLNSFPAVFPLYSLSPDVPAHAHNLFLQTAADSGIFGLVALLVLLTAGFNAAWRVTRSSGSAFERAALIGLAGGLAAFIGYGIWDSMTLGNVPALAAWAMLGTLAAATALYPAPPPAARRQTAPPMRLLLPLALVLAAPLWVSALLVNLGRLSFNLSMLAGQPTPYAIRSAPYGFPAEKLAALAARLNPADSRAFVLAGLEAVARGDPAAALPAFERAVALEPADALTALDLADLYHRLGNDDGAVPLWRATGYAPVLLQLSAGASAAGDYPQAETWAALAAKVEPSNPEAWLRLGRAQKAQGRSEAALAAFTRAASFFSPLSAAYEELAGLLIERGAYQQARLVVAEGWAQADAPGIQLTYLKSRLAYADGEFFSAEMQAEEALERSPSNGTYLAWLGDIYMFQGRFDEAITQYRTAMRKGSPDWAWRGRQRIGALYARLGRHVEALAEYRAAVQISAAQALPASTLAQNHAVLGRALAEGGMLKAARQAYRQALRLDPKNKLALRELAAMDHHP